MSIGAGGLTTSNPGICAGRRTVIAWPARLRSSIVIQPLAAIERIASRSLVVEAAVFRDKASRPVTNVGRPSRCVWRNRCQYSARSQTSSSNRWNRISSISRAMALMSKAGSASELVIMVTGTLVRRVPCFRAQTDTYPVAQSWQARKHVGLRLLPPCFREDPCFRGQRIRGDQSCSGGPLKHGTPHSCRRGIPCRFFAQLVYHALERPQR